MLVPSADGIISEIYLHCSVSKQVNRLARVGMDSGSKISECYSTAVLELPQSAAYKRFTIIHSYCRSFAHAF